MPTIAINGCSIHYEESGSGDTIVFSHGLFWSGRMFEAQRAALSARYRCLAFDHRGQGQSEVTEAGYGMDELWLDAAALLEKLGKGPVHWVGLSMGGFLGLRLAARRPELIRSLSLLNTAADHEPWINRPKYVVLGQLARALGFGPFVGEAMRSMFGAPFLTDPARAEEKAEMERRLAANELRGAIRSLMGVTFRRPVEKELHQIRCPTLVVIGERDAAIKPPRSRRMASLIAGAQVVEIPRAGHSSTIEEPAAVTAALEAFLSSLA
jgi:3-oxoadipate enol-lactonase